MKTEGILAELNAQVVTRIMGRDVTRGELDRAFERVRPFPNWKDPIDCVIPIEDDRERETIAQAITFFTGSAATFRPCYVIEGVARWQVTADGYYLTIGA